jgi:hypothetical protein
MPVLATRYFLAYLLDLDMQIERWLELEHGPGWEDVHERPEEWKLHCNCRRLTGNMHGLMEGFLKIRGIEMVITIREAQFGYKFTCVLF